MKVIYYAHSLLSRGGDKMVLAHAGWLVSRGHEVEFCCNVVDTVLAIPEGIKLSRPALPGTAGSVISAIFGRRDADIVLASIIPMACFLFFRSGRRVVYYAQDYDESYYTSRIFKGIVRLFYFTGLTLFRIPVIACSKPLARLLVNRFHARLEISENGVDAKVFFPDADPQLVASKEGRRAILVLARFDHRKGFDVARETISRLQEATSTDFVVWTIGEPCDGAFPGAHHREFGYVGEERLRRIMSSADVLLYPTRHEGFPLIPLMTMACRTPVVTTTAVPYAVHERNALVAEIEDSQGLALLLAGLFANDALLERLTAEGSRFAGEHTLEACMVRFEQTLAGWYKR